MNSAAMSRYFDGQIQTAQAARKLYQDGAAERRGIQREAYLELADAQANRETFLREVYAALKQTELAEPWLITAGDTSLSNEEFNHVVNLARHVIAVAKNPDNRRPETGNVTFRDVAFANFILELTAGVRPDPTKDKP
jgi:hypothetical protein